MQALTFLFLLFDTLYFVRAAMVPHYVDLAPREAALIKATASKVRKVLRAPPLP